MTRNRELKIVAAGEDFAAVLRVQELAKQLGARLEPAFAVASRAWKFEALENLRLRNEAGRQAARADLVIIASDGVVEPPEHVKSWMESWLPRRRKGMTAVIALLEYEDEARHEVSPLCGYLRRVAGRWGADFFSNSAGWWRRYQDATVQEPQRRRESRRPGGWLRVLPPPALVGNGRVMLGAGPASRPAD